MKKRKQKRETKPKETANSIPWAWVALGVILLFVIGVRARLLPMPLERDEGEFAYVSQLMLQGIVPFEQAYFIKLPGADFIYAASMAVFGQTPSGVHAGLLIATVTSVVLLFLLTRRWFGPLAGVVAAATYGLMSISWSVFGNAAHATQFLVPAALGAILLLLRGMNSGRLMVLFWSGFMFGLAFIIKQPGLLFGFFGGCVLLIAELQRRPLEWLPSLKKLCVFCVGCMLPFALLCLMFWKAGVFGKFWEWTFVIAGGSWPSREQAWRQFHLYCSFLSVSPFRFFWYLAAAALPFVFWMRLARPVRWMFAGFCAASVVAVSLGLKFNPHYFVVALPAVGMLLGLAVAEVWERWKGRGGLAILSVLPGALFLGVCIYAIHADRGYFFLMTPEDEARFIYPRNPFTEAIRVADYIRTNSAPDARITVLGSEPEIYFYSHRRSATCFVSLYQLMEDLPAAPRLRQEMIAEIERVQPEYIVYVSNSTSWVSNGQVNNTILDWANHYLSSRYKVVGVVDGSSPDTPVYLWDAAIAGYTPKSPDHIFVFKKAG